MKLIPLPAFSDNYIWLVHDGRRALVVDPGEAAPVSGALQREGLQLEAILVTHHHADHVGGVTALREATGATVFGPAREALPGEPVQRLAHGDRCTALGLEFQVIDVPGHTAAHIAFWCPAVPLDSADGMAVQVPLLFSGDTLFSGGCGRLFEGTPAQMLASLDALATLPGATRVCCGHEYTLSNLKFALAVEPRNAELVDHAARCEALRARGEPTLPSLLSTELQINPFLRSREPAVAAAATRFDARAADGDVAAFAALREWKNGFR